MSNNAQRVGRNLALPKLDSVARNTWVFSFTPRPIYTRWRPAAHCEGRTVGLGDGLDASGKFHPLSGFETRSTGPLADRYTENDASVIS